MDGGLDPGLARDVLSDVLLGILTGEYVTLSPALWVFLGVLGAFVVTRTITRFIRRRGARGGPATGPIRDITIGGVHVHHQVFGIVGMFLTGLLIITVQPVDAGLDVLAVLLGVSVGLAFDEFALWWHLDDVYWSERGRKSIDAVAWVLVVCASIVCVVKGKLVTAALGLVYPPIGVVGAIRLAKPQSWWARRLYPAGGRRAARTARRFGDDYASRWNRWRDLIGGTPSTTE